MVLGQDIISRLNTIYKGNKTYLKLIKQDWKKFIIQQDNDLYERFYLMVKNNPNGF